MKGKQYVHPKARSIAYKISEENPNHEIRRLETYADNAVAIRFNGEGKISIKGWILQEIADSDVLRFGNIYERADSKGVTVQLRWEA